ncbi:MAG: peptidoglycan D,D-transpeptidase FtsI family protein [Acidiferrobacterales bacterium]
MHPVRRRRFRIRYWMVLGLLLSALGLLGIRATYLQVVASDYLQQQGDARYLRTVIDNAHRGMILDRNGDPLAISTPVQSVWASPQAFMQARRRWSVLAIVLGLGVRDISRQIAKYRDREFTYLKRHVTPEVATRVASLNLPGVFLQREYRRYYPTGAVSGHVVGFTDIDDRGQEGLELAYDDIMRARPGKKRVLKDLYGNVVETVESVSLAEPGRDLIVSLDRRIQYLAYRELKRAMQRYGARAGTAIMLDAHTGEVLAMVNQPIFNPNNRTRLTSARFRNRAATDVFEPGSTLKPFTIAAALETGLLTPDSLINTAPGRLRIGGKTIQDARDYGLLSVAQVIEKSSNVGAAKIALSMDSERLWRVLTRVGFGKTTGSELPAESAGLVNPPSQWVPIDQATLSFGYGISVTALQLARAYAVLANDGVRVPITLLRRDGPLRGERVMSARTARQIRAMLELAVSEEGTGTAARLMHYRVAGKTGTVHKLVPGGYAEDRYVASFAGMAPASKPRLVMVVTVDEPGERRHFGGQTAAPVFSRVMAGALRLLNISPDTPKRNLKRKQRIST